MILVKFEEANYIYFLLVADISGQALDQPAAGEELILANLVQEPLH